MYREFNVFWCISLGFYVSIGISVIRCDSIWSYFAESERKIIEVIVVAIDEANHKPRSSDGS